MPFTALRKTLSLKEHKLHVAPMPSSLKKYLPLKIVALIAIHLAIALPLAYLLSIWNDEGSSLYATQNGFFRAFESAATEQKQAPLYFWILSFWRQLNQSIFFARLFSIICSVAAIWLFSRLSVRILRPRTAFLATAFFALHPVLLWASLEIRVYSLVILLSIALTHFFLDAFLEDSKNDWPARIRFLLLAIFSLYTNYYLGFMLVGFFVALLLLRRWRCAFSYITLMAVAGLAFLPMILAVLAEFQDRNSSYNDARSLVDGLKLLWYHLLTFLLPTDITPSAETPAVATVRLWVVRLALVATVALTVVRWKRISAQTIGLAALTATLLIFLLVAYFLLGRWLVELRHASVLFAPLLIFGASLVNDILPKRETPDSMLVRLGLPAFVIVVLIAFAYTMANLYPGFAKRGDWEHVGRYIKQNESENQPILIFCTYDTLTLPYHYGGVNKIYPDERFFEFDFGTPSPERAQRRTDFTISEIPPNVSEMWLILNDECKIPGNCEQLNAYINTSFDRVSETAFRDQTVTLLRKKSEAASTNARP